MEKLSWNKKFWLIIGIIIAIVLIAILSIEKSREEKIKIGGILSLTGNASQWGVPAQRGMQLAIEEINSRGGIKGTKIEPIYEDHEFEPKKALSAYQLLKARGVKIFLTNGAPIAATLGPVVKNDKNLEFETGAVTPVFSDGSFYTCRIALTTSMYGPVLGRFIIDKFGKNVGFLMVNNEYGISVEQDIERTVIDFGGKTIIKERFTIQDTDFRTQIEKIKAKDYSLDALVVITTPKQTPVLFKQLREADFQKPIISDNWTIVSSNLQDLSLVEGVIFSDYSFEPTIDPEESEMSKKFKENYKKRWNEEASVNAMNAYDAIYLLAKAMKIVGFEPADIGRELANNTKNWRGVGGLITLDNDCEWKTRDVMIRTIKNGQFMPHKE